MYLTADIIIHDVCLSVCYRSVIIILYNLLCDTRCVVRNMYARIVLVTGREQTNMAAGAEYYRYKPRYGFPAHLQPYRGGVVDLVRRQERHQHTEMDGTTR